MNEDKDYSLVTSAFFGAIAGAAAAVLITGLVDKKSRNKLGETLLFIRHQGLKTLRFLGKMSAE